MSEKPVDIIETLDDDLERAANESLSPIVVVMHPHNIHIQADPFTVETEDVDEFTMVLFDFLRVCFNVKEESVYFSLLGEDGSTVEMEFGNDANLKHFVREEE